jgi:hypothetical protein
MVNPNNREAWYRFEPEFGSFCGCARVGEWEPECLEVGKVFEEGFEVWDFGEDGVGLGLQLQQSINGGACNWCEVVFGVFFLKKKKIIFKQFLSLKFLGVQKKTKNKII